MRYNASNSGGVIPEVDQATHAWDKGNTRGGLHCAKSEDLPTKTEIDVNFLLTKQQV
jgi:hypothetical protein